ncbi:MAG: TIR domain-containing protein [Candidatus Poribacteria bacterium]|nr:TIR domain-containing protein [Candidatus Poribacteria bacterium]
MRTYNLFISHSWADSDMYNKLIHLLNSKRDFSYRDYSVPKDDPLDSDGTDENLYNAIKTQIARSSVVLILMGIEATDSKWINQEIRIAKNEFRIPKPVIAIESSKNNSDLAIVKQGADRIVDWNPERIVSAIREVV